MGDRGQAAVEFAIVLAVGFLILLPATFVFISYSRGSSDSLRMNQAVQFGTDLMNKAETVYYYSDPSHIEATEVLPSGVQNMTIVSDWPNNVNLLIIDMKVGNTVQPLVFSSNVDINGTFDAKSIAAGRKTATLTVKKRGIEPYVDITLS